MKLFVPLWGIQTHHKWLSLPHMVLWLNCVKKNSGKGIHNTSFTLACFLRPCLNSSLSVSTLLHLSLFCLHRSRSLTTAFLQNPPLSASLFESWMRTTTDLYSWRRSTRSNSRSERGQRKREPQRGTRCTEWLLLIVMRDLMQRSLTALKREMKTESSSSSQRLAWCLLRSFPLLGNTTFLQ